jgi:hypothetical protein
VQYGCTPVDRRIPTVVGGQVGQKDREPIAGVDAGGDGPTNPGFLAALRIVARTA